MFEEYLQDSYEFLLIANSKCSASKEKEAKRYYRASVFFALGAMESFVNYIADSFAKAKSLEEYEICFLNDKVMYFQFDKGLIERTEFHKLDHKIRLLVNKFIPEFNFQSITWNNFMRFKNFRDTLVHPRNIEDETELGDYKQTIQQGLKAIIEIMNNISNGVFKKPIRKQLLDLIPE